MPTAAFISFIVGVLATIMAGFTLISTKENKVSDNRQAWIDAMREDIAGALAAAFAAERAKDEKDKTEFLKTFDECQARIEMREHTSLTKWPEVREAFASIRGYINGEAGPYKPLKSHKELILRESRKQLKKNWQIVKQGETFFQIFKWTFVGWLAALGLTLMFINGFNLFSEGAKSRPSDEAKGVSQTVPGNIVGRVRQPTSSKALHGQVGNTRPAKPVDVRQ